MKGLIGEYIEQLHIERIRHRKVSAWTTALALLVVSCVVWGLRVRGISLTNDTDCGIEEHIHSASCYDLYEVCGLAEGEMDSDGITHSHTTECYMTKLACGIDEHIHTVECLDVDTDSIDDEIDKSGENTEPEGELELSEIAEFEEEEESILEELIDEKEIVSGISLLAAPDPAETENETYYKELIKQVLANKDEEPIRYGEFYVLTATGLRWADKVNEYLVEANGPAENIINNTPGVYYEETLADGRKAYYLRNAGWPSEKALPEGVSSTFKSDYDQYRYLLYPDDDLTLVVFRTNEQRLANDGAGCWIYSVGENGAIIDPQGRFELSGELDDNLSGTDVIVARINSGTAGQYGTYYYDRISGVDDGDVNNYWGDWRYESFHTYVRTAGRTYTHSDIEIADGGFFNVSTTRNYEDGTYNVVTTHYDSYVSDVNKCEIYRNGKDTIVYGPECYEKLSNDATQNEITSQFYCASRTQYHYDVADVTHVVFEIALALAPTTSVIEEYDSNGNLINRYTESYADSNGNFSYEVQWLTVDMDRKSVIDAINKCPNNSGMDFNLKYAEVSIKDTRPVIDQFSVKKETVGDDISPSNFKFQLLDTSSATPTIVADDIAVNEDGTINIPEIEFARPGTYHYKIKEKIPVGAVEIADDVWYLDYVRYDGREIDITVVVEVMPGMLAVVDGSADSEDAYLKTTVTYSIDGVNLDLGNAEDLQKLTFTNEAFDHQEKDLEVRKKWLGDATHDDDNITFRIIQTKNGAETSYYDVAGETVFELNKSNGWYMSFENLPIILGADSYSYEIQETQMIEYVPSYSKKETDTLISWTISNTKNQDRYLHFEKKWTDDEGNEIEAPEGVDNVHIKLRRQYQEKEIILYVKVQSTDGGDEYTDLFELPAYKGGKVEFQLESTPGNYQELAIANTVNCTCSIDDNRVYTVEINDYNPEITLRYRPVTDSDLRLWHTNSSGFRSSESSYNTWNSFGTGSSDTTRDLKDCWVTVYTNTETFSSGYKLINRVNNYAAAELKLNPSVYLGGQYYSFNAYVRYQKEFTTPVVGDVVERTTSITSTPTMLKMQLRFNRPGEGSEWIDIATVPGYEEGTPPSQNVWYQLNNVSFRIPDNCENLALTITAVEPNNADNQYVDLYFDDVIIAPGMIKTDVNKNTGRLEAVRLYNVVNESHTIPSEAMTWQEDVESGENIYSFTIEKDSDWTKSLQISSFGTDGKGVPELPDRNYRYYIVEEFGDDERDKIIVDYYKVFYYDDYVAHNTAETPIIVENQYHAYVLPNTGGIGSNKIRWLGLLILLAGIPPALVNLVRKRGRPSG